MLRSILLGLCLVFASTAPAEPAAPPLLVYGAASLSDALNELGTRYTRRTGRVVKFSLAASSMLARQIEAGARADVFFSADLDWMDYLQSRGHINTASRVNVLSNKLVLIAPSDSAIKLDIAPRFPLAAALGTGRLSTGDPDSVPVGKYARSALQHLGVWNDVANKLVRADSVRSALAFVDRGEAPLGIVYLTDALIDKNVRVVAEFPSGTHPPIVYPIALTTSASTGADAFVAFLRSAGARAVFEKYGFGQP